MIDTQEGGHIPYDFMTEEPKAAYDAVMTAGRARFGVDEFANSVEAKEGARYEALVAALEG